MAKNIKIFCSVSLREIENVKCWLIPSLLKQKGNHDISLYLINYTGQGRIYDGASRIGGMNIIEIKKDISCGFGEAHNFAFNFVKPDNFFIIVNPDVYFHELCISEMIRKIKEDNKIGIVEARQFPFEHPKEYDKKTGETPWASGCCLLIKSKFFREVNGFDESFWMYCEDVDLSWRAWISGYKVIHDPMAVVYHFTGAYFEYTKNRFYIEQFWSARNFIYLMYKYWGAKGEKKAIKYFSETNYPEYFKKEVIESFVEIDKNLTDNFRLLNKKKIEKKNNRIKVQGFNLYHKTNSK